MTSYLWSTDGSGFHTVACSTATIDRLQSDLQQQRQDAVVRTIAGSKSRTQDDFFMDVASALEFPAYFGKNWSAFNDCILDMDWLPGSAYILLFTDAHMLMDQSQPESLAALAEILSEARDAWQPLPFHGIFQAPPEHIKELSERLTAAGFTLDPTWPGDEPLEA